MNRLARLASIAIALVGILGTTNTASAQTAPDPQRVVERIRNVFEQYESLLKDMVLTDEQKAKTDQLLLDARDAVKSLLQDPNTEPREKMQSVRQKLAGVQNDIRQLLTDEQKAKFDAGIDVIDQGMPRRGTTQPAGEAGQRNPRGLQLITRLERALSIAELTEEQKPKVQSVLDNARGKLIEIRDEAIANGDPATVREKARALREEVQSELAKILTAEQRTKLREVLDADRPVPPGRDADQNQKAQVRADGNAATTSTSVPTARPNAGISPIRVGESVPPFSLMQLDGKALTEKSFQGRPTVILFGSYSSPATRDRIAKLQDLAEKSRNKAKFIFIYTSEMYPADVDQPTRNVDDKIAVAAHKTMDERSAAARNARDTLKITFDIAPDTLDATLQKTLGVESNGAAIVRADGKLFFRQDWADPFAIERALGEALSAK